MPSGYTAGILDGTITNFNQFAKLCARAFGATIHMRDDNLTDEYKQREPSTYHVEELEKAKQKQSDATGFDDNKIVEVYLFELNESQKYHEKKLVEIEKNAKVLNQFLNEAKKYNPPTEDHTGIKQFLIEQIQSTIDWDAKPDYHLKALDEIKLNKAKSVDMIRAELIEKAQKDIAYHTKELKAEIERCEKSNKWVKDYYDSFNS